MDPKLNLPEVRANSSLRNWTEKRVQDWTIGASRGDELKTAADYVDDLPPSARKFIDYLLVQPHFQADADELMSVLHLPSRRSVGSTTSVFGRLRKKHGKLQPFEVRQFQGSDLPTIYFIPHEIAAVLTQVI